jgi:hypothetical protein
MVASPPHVSLKFSLILSISLGLSMEKKRKEREEGRAGEKEEKKKKREWRKGGGKTCIYNHNKKIKIKKLTNKVKLK